MPDLSIDELDAFKLINQKFEISESDPAIIPVYTKLSALAKRYGTSFDHQRSQFDDLPAAIKKISTSLEERESYDPRVDSKITEAFLQDFPPNREAYEGFLWIFLTWILERSPKSPKDHQAIAAEFNRSCKSGSDQSEAFDAFPKSYSQHTKIKVLTDETKRLNRHYRTNNQKCINLLRDLYRISFPEERRLPKLKPVGPHDAKTYPPLSGPSIEAPIKRKRKRKGGQSRNRLHTIPKLTNVSNTFWNPIERNAFLTNTENVISNYAESDRPRAVAAFLISLAYHLPRELKDWYRAPFGEHKSLSRDLKYVIDLHYPEEAKDLDAELNGHTRKCLDRLELEMPDRLKSQISMLKLAPPTGDSIGDWLGIAETTLLRLCVKLLKEWRIGQGFLLSPRYLMIQARTACQLVTGDPLLNHFFFGSTNDKPPNSIYYQSIAIDKVHYGWDLIHQYLSDPSYDADPEKLKDDYLNFAPERTYDEQPFVGQSVLDSSKRMFVRSLIEKTRFGLSNTTDPIVRHNIYVNYVTSLLMWGLGIRAVRDPIPYAAWLNIEKAIALIQDKVTNEGTLFRLTGIPQICLEALGKYKQHLQSLSYVLHRSPDKNIQNTAKVISSMLSAGRNQKPKTPFLFYLSEDGYATDSITKSSIGSYWESILPLPANYGRKFIYEKLIQSSIEDVDIRSVLGHQSVSGTIFSHHNVEPFPNSLSRSATQINAALLEAGWETLDGIKSNRTKDFPTQSRSSPQEANIHKSTKLGPTLRASGRARKEKEAKLLLEEILRSLELEKGYPPEHLSNTKAWNGKIALELLEALESIIESDQQKSLRTKASRAKKHLYGKIKRLAGVDRQFRDLANEVPIEFREKFPVSESAFINYQYACEFKSNFKQYLKEKSSDPTDKTHSSGLILCEIVISSAIYSLISDTTLLSQIPDYVRDVRIIDGKCTWTHPSSQGIIDQPAFRWIANPVTALLTNKLQTKRLRRNEILEVEDRLSKLLKSLLPAEISHQSDKPFMTLAKLAKALAIFERVPFLRLATSKPASTQRLTNQSFVNYITGKHTPVSQALKSGRLIDTKTNSAQAVALPKAYKILAKTLRKHTKQAKRDNFRTNVSARKSLYEDLDGQMDFFSTQYQIVQALYYWVVDSCEHGLIRTKDPSLSTIYNYFSKISKHLIRLIGQRTLDTISHDEFMSLYEHVAQSVHAGSQKVSKLTPFKQFHTFISSVDDWNIPDIDWSDIDIPVLDSASCVASYTSMDNYEYLLNHYLEDIDISQLDNIDKAALLFLCRRFGLRRDEALSLKTENLHFDFAQSEYWVRKRNRTKSDHSIRQIRLIGEPSPLEVKLMRILTTRDAVLQAADAGKVPIFEQTGDREQDSFYDNLISAITFDLRQLTGDPSLTIHSLRHSWATDRTDLVLSPQQQANSGRDSLYYHSILQISASIGHSDQNTLTRTYANTPEIQVSKRENEILDDISAPIITRLSGKPYSSIRRNIANKTFEYEKLLTSLPRFDLTEPDIKLDGERQTSSLSLLRIGRLLLTSKAQQLERDTIQKLYEVAGSLQNQVGLDIIGIGRDYQALQDGAPLKPRALRRLLRDLEAADSAIGNASNSLEAQLSSLTTYWLTYYSARSPKCVQFIKDEHVIEFLTNTRKLNPKGFRFEYRFFKTTHNKNILNEAIGELISHSEETLRPNRRGQIIFPLSLVPKTPTGNTPRDAYYDIYMLILSCYCALYSAKNELNSGKRDSQR